MAPPYWLVCQICRRSGISVGLANLNMTNCGLIYCTNCTGRLGRRVCEACQVVSVGCKRTVRLNSRAPREVWSLFGSFERKINM